MLAQKLVDKQLEQIKINSNIIRALGFFRKVVIFKSPSSSFPAIFLMDKSLFPATKTLFNISKGQFFTPWPREFHLNF